MFGIAFPVFPERMIESHDHRAGAKLFGNSILKELDVGCLRKFRREFYHQRFVDAFLFDQLQTLLDGGQKFDRGIVLPQDLLGVRMERDEQRTVHAELMLSLTESRKDLFMAEMNAIVTTERGDRLR